MAAGSDLRKDKEGTPLLPGYKSDSEKEQKHLLDTRSSHSDSERDQKHLPRRGCLEPLHQQRRHTQEQLTALQHRQGELEQQLQ